MQREATNGRDILGRGHDAPELVVGLVAPGDALLDLVSARIELRDGSADLGADGLRDLVRRLVGAVGELPDLIGDDGEAPAVLPGTDGLDRALSAIRLVWSVMSLITATMRPISSLR